MTAVVLAAILVMVAAPVTSVAAQGPGGEPPNGPPDGGGFASLDTGTGAYILTDGEELTGASYITEFNGSIDNVDLNGYTLYVNGSAMAD